jgi:DNA-binding Lrp family transcriptional regulator
VKAYVLIHASPGRSIELAAEIRSVPGILAADAITGDYDIIAVGEASDVRSLGVLVVNHIQKLEGVFKTTTCHVLRERPGPH